MSHDITARELNQIKIDSDKQISAINLRKLMADNMNELLPEIPRFRYSDNILISRTQSYIMSSIVNRAKARTKIDYHN